MHSELVSLRIDTGHCGLDCGSQDRVECNPFFAELDLAAVDAAHIEQVVDQPRGLCDLSAHHRERIIDDRRIGLALEYCETVAKRREGVSELVRQHREELALVRVGPLKLKRALAQRFFGRAM